LDNAQPDARGAESGPLNRSDFRRKDPDILEMANTLEHFEDVLLKYTKALEDELAGEQAKTEPNAKLVAGLLTMTALLKGFATFVDQDMWTWMITVADRSTSHVHRRTGRFF
jgi:hypothetical protein